MYQGRMLQYQLCITKLQYSVGAFPSLARRPEKATDAALLYKQHFISIGSRGS
jgi:hypothetical protein